MDWSNERYVRLYTRDTTTWKRLGWDGQNLLMQLLRKLDMAGTIELDGLEPWEAAMLHVGAPEEPARRGLEIILKVGVAVVRGDLLVFPNYIPAQEASKSDKQRQRESRANRSANIVTKRDAQSRNVMDPSRPVTSSHEQSQSVTVGHSVLCSAVPCSALPCSAVPDSQISDPEFARGSADVPLAAPGSDSATSEPEPPDPDADPPQRSETSDAAPADVLPATTVAPSESTALTVPSGAGNQHSAKPQRKSPVAKTKQEPQPSKSAGAWAAYTAAYHARYTTAPVRNARVNAQMAQFVARVAAEEAPAIAEHYLRSQNSRYLASGHSVGCLLQDAEKLRTEWVTGRHSTAHAARTADRTTGRGEAYREMMDRLRLEDEADARRMSNGH